jgi:hypothetical protein
MSSKADPGGTTTQAGIKFQNDLAVLRIADMLAGMNSMTSHLGTVVSVRVEATDKVDDIVVKYSSARTEYVQAKTNIEPGDEAWGQMWAHFYDQFRQPDFRRGLDGDIITLAVNSTPKMSELESLLRYAEGASSFADWSDSRPNQTQRSILKHIRDSLRGVSPEPDDETVLELCRHVRVARETGSGALEAGAAAANRVYNTLKDKFARSEVIYDALYAIVQEGAAFRQTHNLDSVIARLRWRGITQTYNYGEHVPLMCDRSPQEGQVTASIHRALTARLERCPQLFLIPGELGEGHNNLVKRFRHTVIEDYAKKRKEVFGPVVFKEIEEEWPSTGDMEENKDILRVHVFKHFDPGYDAKSFDELTPAALRALIMSPPSLPPSFVVIRHHIREWNSRTFELIEWYRHFWHEVRGDALIPDCLIFLNVVYSPALLKQLKKSGWWAKSSESPVADALKGVLHLSPPGQGDGAAALNCSCTVLKELSPVELQHVLNWFDSFNIRNASIVPEERSKSIFRDKGGRLAKWKHMSDVEPGLREVYEEFLRG